MNATYHIKAATREEFNRILQKMIDEQDPALCCANVEWTPVRNDEKEKKS